jgi:diguanylate cyclase (GGDEF)-like protein
MNGDDESTTQIQKLTLPMMPTVLIVDDDALVLERLKELVAAEGYPVHTATSGKDALDSLHQLPASIVITDLRMEGMDGLDLCRRIRETTWPGYVYVVLLTVKDEEKDVLAGLDAGADDYVSKRTSAAQFTARLRTAQRILALEYSLRNALEKKHEAAMTDALTGVYNRRYFTRHLGRELKRAQRFGGDVSLLLLDIDHFKRINDSHGHTVGDMVLKRLTREVAECLRRETDWCARLGGDEFAVVLEGTSSGEALACAEKVRRAIAHSPVATSSGAVRFTVSIGVSGSDETLDGRSVTVQDLMKEADQRLYAGKASGRNRVTPSASKDKHLENGNASKRWASQLTRKTAVGSVR